MDKFNSIIKEFKMRTDTSFPYTYTATKWDKPITPITPNSQNASINKVSNVTTNISEPEYKEVYFPPSQWNDSDIAEFLAKLLEGNMLGAMGKLINDPSIETILNEDQMKNTLQVPLDTIISSVGNMSGMITNDANIATSNINSQVASESNVPQDGNDITPDLSPTKNLIGNTQAYDPKQPVSMPSSNNQPGAASDPKTAEAQHLGSIIEQAKLITEKIKGLFTEQTVTTALANLETIFGDGEAATKKTNRDTKKIRKAIEEAAIQDNWQDSLRELSSSFSGIQQPVSTPATESFNRIINDYINLNRLDEVAPVAALGLAALGGSIISIMVKYFIASTAISIVNIIGSIISRAITMPLKIIMLVIQKLKKYKNFLLGIFMPVQVISGVIIKSGGQAGQFTGPMMQEWLQKITDFLLEITSDIFGLIGLDSLVKNAGNMGKGWGGMFNRIKTHVTRVAPMMATKAAP